MYKRRFNRPKKNTWIRTKPNNNNNNNTKDNNDVIWLIIPYGNQVITKRA